MSRISLITSIIEQTYMEEERNRSSVSNQQTQTGGYNQNVNQYPYDRQYTHDRQQPYCSQYPYDRQYSPISNSAMNYPNSNGEWRH